MWREQSAGDLLGETEMRIVKLRGKTGYSDKIPPEKNHPEKIHLNAVEREPVTTRVFNPNASKANYKPKHRSYRKTMAIISR